MKALAWLPLILTTGTAGAALRPGLLTPDLPRDVLPEGVGVNIHFTRGHEPDLDLIAAAGFRFVRMDFSWGGTERKKGEYDWSAYDELTANLEKRRRRPLYILDYSNGLYEDTITSKNPITGREQRDTASPQKPESVAAFARWAAAAARHFKGHSIIWEIWNEPNISFWKPGPDVKQYTTLVQATVKAMREANPQVTLVAPASSGFPWEFFESLFTAPGVLEHLDGISVHPYRSYSKGPETAADDYLRLRGLIERFAPPARKFIPILSGEWGYATHAKGGVSLETQAAFIVRQQLANLLEGVPLSIWYDWKNDGTDPNYNEHNFGTVSNNLALKPSYRAVQTLTRQLDGFRIVRRLDTPNAADYVLLLVHQRTGQPKLAAWTTGQPHAVSLPLGAASPDDVSLVDLYGQAREVRLQGRDLVLALDAAPQYLALKGRSDLLMAAAAWELGTPLPTLIEAGGGAGVAVPVEVRNPFQFTARAKLTLVSPEGTNTVTQTMRARQLLHQTFTFKPARRTPEPVPVTVSVEFHEPLSGDGTRFIARSSETRRFLISNPLKLSLAPVEQGLRLSVENPSRRRFEGKAIVSDASLPIRFDEGVELRTVTAPTTPHTARAQLLDATGQPATDSVTARFVPLRTPPLKAALDGDAKVPARANLVETNAPVGAEAPFPRAWRLDYEFDAGWRFVRCASSSKQPVSIEGAPQSLGLWVYGDHSGNALRVRVTDASGQTFQPGGPNLTWTGWRWVTFDLTNLGKAGHWGGANDGVVHGSLRLDTLLLVDGTRAKTAGTVWFAGPTLVYAASPK